MTTSSCTSVLIARRELSKSYQRLHCSQKGIAVKHQSLLSSSNSSVGSVTVRPCVQALSYCRRYQEAKDWAEAGLAVEDQDSLVGLRAKAVEALATIRKKERLQKREEKRLQSKEAVLVEALKTRGVRWVPAPNGQVHVLEEQSGARATVSAEGHVLWPMVFMYPEHQQTDIILQADEATRLADHFAVRCSGSLLLLTKAGNVPG